MPVPHQDTAARRYRIEKYLTEGGMGAIYIGKKLGPGGFAKEVVLKQLLPEYTSRPEFRDLFFREAKISATLDHANIVHTFDLVESDQSLFIVMEYVRGADLRTIIRRARQRKRELSPAAAIHIALEILSGLGYAHARRDASGKSLDIIHRDVSPSNIICSVEGAAKLSDFGIAKASTYSSVFYRVRGKVGYMSPEQARSQPIDHRCDLFSLSVCLYESLSGERLFVGDLNTPADEIYSVPILPVSQKRAGLPPALDDVMARALAPQVDDRYQNAAELGEALRTVAHRNGLAFSAPELAAHLRDILGDEPERWLRDEPTAAASDPQAASAPAPNSDLVGREASSIGIVDDIPQDTPGRGMLSPRPVSGTKDFDLDSMLDDEATRPGRAGAALTPPPASETAKGQGAQDGHGGQDGRVQAPLTPPPVWTRNSSPFPLATPHPAAAATPGPAAVTPRPASPTPRPVRSLPTPRPTRSGAPPAGRPQVRASAPPPPPAPPPLTASPPVPPPALSSTRPLPRPASRMTAVPPPFAPARSTVPPPPPFPAHDARGPFGDGIEDATPGPPGMLPTPLPARPQGFDIEDVLTPAPAGHGYPPGQPRGGSRGFPPPGQQGYAPPPPEPSYPYAVPADPPLVLNQPQTINFQGSVNALPDRKSGPPGWLTAAALMVSLVGGAVLAHRFVGKQAEALVMAAPTGRVVPTAQEARPEPEEAPSDVPAPSKPAPRPEAELDAPAAPLGEPEALAGAAGAAKGPAVATARSSAKVSSGKAKRGAKVAKRAAAKPQKHRGKR